MVNFSLGTYSPNAHRDACPVYEGDTPLLQCHKDFFLPGSWVSTLKVRLR